MRSRRANDILLSLEERQPRSLEEADEEVTTEETVEIETCTSGDNLSTDYFILKSLTRVR